MGKALPLSQLAQPLREHIYINSGIMKGICLKAWVGEDLWVSQQTVCTWGRAGRKMCTLLFAMFNCLCMLWNSHCSHGRTACHEHVRKGPYNWRWCWVYFIEQSTQWQCLKNGFTSYYLITSHIYLSLYLSIYISIYICIYELTNMPGNLWYIIKSFIRLFFNPSGRALLASSSKIRAWMVLFTHFA